MNRYQTLSGDRNLSARLTFYRLAYLSFRVAYSRLAIENTDALDSAKFREREVFYISQLRRRLMPGSSRS